MKEFSPEELISPEVVPPFNYTFYHCVERGQNSEPIGESISATDDQDAINKFQEREGRRYGEDGDSFSRVDNK